MSRAVVRRVAIRAGSVALVAAVGAAGAHSFPAARVAPTRAPAAAWASCRNRAQGFTVSYPAGWHRPSNEDEGSECMIFDPLPVVAYPDGNFAALWVKAHDYMRFDDLASLSDDGYRVVDRSATSAGGRRAIRQEVVADGTGMEPAGMLIYTVWLDRDGVPVEISTFSDADDAAYREHKAVVDHAAETILF